MSNLAMKKVLSEYAEIFHAGPAQALKSIDLIKSKIDSLQSIANAIQNIRKEKLDQISYELKRMKEFIDHWFNGDFNESRWNLFVNGISATVDKILLEITISTPKTL